MNAALLAAMISSACAPSRLLLAQASGESPGQALAQLLAQPAPSPQTADESPLLGTDAGMPQPMPVTAWPQPTGQQPSPTPASQAPQKPSDSSPASSSALPDAPKPAQASTPPKEFDCTSKPCQVPIINWYMRFENGPQVKPLTPTEKAWLATKNVIDPFNAITILGEAGISVAADSHSAYGPGFPGWGRYVGVSYTEDITGEFFGTFLIPSLVHQDPHYHRMPKASYPKRIFHAIDQIVWTEGDDGRGMLNYADLVGYGIDDEIANLYVPGRKTNAGATAQRYGIALATAPIGNFITEFLPDVASHIHVQVVIVQRIINQVANKESNGT
jgi:hypothetical protein